MSLQKEAMVFSLVTASNLKPALQTEEKKQLSISENEFSPQKPVNAGAPTSLTSQGLKLKIENLAQALKPQQALSRKWENSIKQHKKSQTHVRNKSNARIRELEAKNEKLMRLAKANEILISEIEKLKISQKKQKADHKRMQKKMKVHYRGLENTNRMLHIRIKNLKGEGLKNENGNAELNAEITRLHNLLKSQESIHAVAKNRINELEARLAANAARARGDNNSRFRRPNKDFPRQEELPRMKRPVKPWYNRNAIVNKNSRFARPGRDLPNSSELGIKCEPQKKNFQSGRGCLLLWPSSMLNEAQEFFQIARKKSKNIDMVVSLLAIPVTVSMSWHECPPSNPWGKNTCLDNCPVVKFAKDRIASDVLEKAIIVTKKKGLPDATVRLNLFRAVIEEFRSFRIQWNQLCSRPDAKDLCWLCVVETISEQGLNKNHTYHHVDVNLSGWGTPNRWETGEAAAHRKTVDQTGIDVKDLLGQGLMREVIHVFSTSIYAPTNKFYYKGIESQLKLQQIICDDYLSSKVEDHTTKSQTALMRSK